MKNSTFCVLLAGVLMLLGGIYARLIQNQPEAVTAYEEAMPVTEVEAQNPVMIQHVSGEKVYEYGVHFDQTLKCWSMKDHLMINAEDTMLIAASKCVVEEVGCVEGGSRLTLRAGNGRLIIWPVTGVLIFEGSRIMPGGEIGRVAGEVSFAAVVDEKMVDPAELITRLQ